MVREMYNTSNQTILMHRALGVAEKHCMLQGHAGAVSDLGRGCQGCFTGLSAGLSLEGQAMSGLRKDGVVFLDTCSSTFVFGIRFSCSAFVKGN